MLTDNQVAFFRQHGYVVMDGLLTGDELARARAEMAALLGDPDSARPRVAFSCEPEAAQGASTVDPVNPRRVWMIFDTPLAGDWWYDNIRDRRVVTAVSQLLGPDVDFHNGKARIKPPGYGSHQVWHQDWPYERHTSPDLVAAILYLDDTDVGAAATEVIPGSHLQGEWPHDADNAIPQSAVDAFGAAPVPLAVRAGAVAIIHVLVVHRATPNATDRNRSAIINEYKAHETRDRWGNRCAFADLPLWRDGRPY